MADTIPDVPPPLSSPTPSPSAPPKPTISSPNSFFLYLVIILAYMIYHRLAWESVVTMVSGFGEFTSVLNILFYLWLIPILGILFSIVFPSLGTTTLWLIGSSIASAVPLSLVWIYVLIWGYSPSN